MTSTMRAGIIGLVLGFLLGLVGSLLAWVPFWIALVRILLGSLAGALIVSFAHWLLGRFLPELVQEGSEPVPGAGIDVQLDGDVNPYGDDQAADLRAMAAGAGPRDPAARADESWSYGTASPRDGDTDDVMVEEVQEQGGVDEIENFSEDAFYSGIDQLPDIGGFSEQFTSRGDPVDEAGSAPVDFDEPSRPSKGSGGSKGKGGMDPHMMAQAIRTALKKE